MHSSKFFQLLSSVKKNKGEIADFERFVKSPYFNPKQELIDILVLIKNNWHLKEELMKKKLDKETAYFKIFPKEKKYNARKFNDCLYRLSLLIEQYFAVKEMLGQPYQEKLFLGDALATRGLDKYYFKETNALKIEMKAKLAEDAASNLDIYMNLARVEEQIYYHPNTLTHSEKENDQLLTDAMEYLDTGYIVKKLQFCCEVYTRMKIYGKMEPPRLLDELLEIAKKDFKDNLVIKAYVGILELFRSEDTLEIGKTKSLVFKLLKFDYLDCRLDLIAQLINAIPVHPNRLKLYFELYQYAADNGVLLEHGYISPANFNNIIHIGCAVGQYEWTENFMKKYLPSLDDSREKRENIALLFNAYFNYYQGKYEKAYYHQLLNLRLKDVTYGLRYHILLLQVLTDDKDNDGTLEKIDFDDKCKAFKRYLNKKYKDAYISRSVFVSIMNFIEILPKIYHWRYNNISQQELLDQLNAYHDIPRRGWLLYKVNRLNKSRK